MKESDIVIVGGGLAGLTAAIVLSEKGHKVQLIERHPYPRHKVCGEYLSLEVAPILESLGICLKDAVPIRRFRCYGPAGQAVQTDLPLGAIGISRYALDERLAAAAVAAGAELILDQALSIEHRDNQARIFGRHGSYTGKVLLSAWGKRSTLDRAEGRAFWNRKSHWMALKTHFVNVDFPSDEVGLYFFKGGYAGCSLTESGHLNFCCLIEKEHFRTLGRPGEALEAIIGKHPKLRDILQTATPRFENPLSIAQIDFGRKELKHENGLYCGDAAHLIHPLCGNGMAMAIHSGYMAADLSDAYLRGNIESKGQLTDLYTARWKKAFASRLRWGRFLQKALTHPAGIQWAVRPGLLPPAVLRKIIEKTHGTLLVP